MYSPEYNKKWKKERYASDPEYRRKCRERAMAYRARMGKTHRQARQYGLTREQVENQLSLQENRCKICGDETKLVIDHCHATGKFRGMLCSQCNRGIGCLKDNPAILRKGAEYIEVHQPQFTSSL